MFDVKLSDDEYTDAYVDLMEFDILSGRICDFMRKLGDVNKLKLFKNRYLNHQISWYNELIDAIWTGHNGEVPLPDLITPSMQADKLLNSDDGGSEYIQLTKQDYDEKESHEMVKKMKLFVTVFNDFRKLTQARLENQQTEFENKVKDINIADKIRTNMINTYINEHKYNNNIRYLTCL